MEEVDTSSNEVETPSNKRGRPSNSESESDESDDSNDELHEVPFPPQLDDQLLWWNDETNLMPLRVGRIKEVGHETHAFKFVFRDGQVRYLTMREMETRCTAHNKLVTCENQVVHKNIEKAVSEAYGPAYEAGSQSIDSDARWELADQIRSETGEAEGDSSSTVVGPETTPVSSVSVDVSSSRVEGPDTIPVSSLNVDGSEVVAETLKVLVDAVMTHVENKGSLSNTFGMPGTLSDESKADGSKAETAHKTPAQSQEGREAPVTSEQSTRTSSKYIYVSIYLLLCGKYIYVIIYIILLTVSCSLV